MILDLADARAQLNVTSLADDDLILRKAAAAQNHIENLLGFKIEDEYGGAEQDPIPPALVEAVALLTGHLYENREATLVGVTAQQLPFGLWDVVNEYRLWSWGEPDNA
jgi:hypothetical protein